ncbi:hypothetical protein N9Y17_03310 [Gammaproteobacteria bacterium]|nr:hypothetical protein [Gammaproteobacteria bacterium]
MIQLKRHPEWCVCILSPIAALLLNLSLHQITIPQKPMVTWTLAKLNQVLHQLEQNSLPVWRLTQLDIHDSKLCLTLQTHHHYQQALPITWQKLHLQNIQYNPLRFCMVGK